MSPRRSAEDARRTRERLVAVAADMASMDGLEGVTLGRLADATGMSKSGVARHFVSEERLQLAALDNALERFTREVWAPVADRPPGRERLVAVCEAWTAYLAGDTFRGGCFLTAASAEFDGREGPVRDAIQDALRRWLALLAGEARVAVRAGELSPGTDPDALAYTLNALALAANQARQLLDDDDAPRRSLELMRGAIGVNRGPRSALAGRRG